MSQVNAVGARGTGPGGYVPGASHGWMVFEAARFVLIHVAAIAGTWVFGLTPAVVAWGVALYIVRMFGVTAGYHRYFSHRTFETSRPFAFLLAFLAETSTQRGVIWWASNHRHHHRYADRPEDLHSPARHGFLHAHVGWLFDRANRVKRNNVADLERRPELAWLDRHWMVPPTLLAALSLALFGWPGLFGGFLLSTVFLWHGTFTINSLSHVFGSRRFDTPDTSRNNPLLAVLTLGEGWHNNHHHDMRACRQGLAWWEFDPTWRVLKILEGIGLVWKLRPHRPEDRARVSRAPA